VFDFASFIQMSDSMKTSVIDLRDLLSILSVAGETSSGIVFRGNRLLINTQKLPLGWLKPEAAGGRLQRDLLSARHGRAVSVHADSPGRAASDIRQHSHRSDRCTDAEVDEADSYPLSGSEKGSRSATRAQTRRNPINPSLAAGRLNHGLADINLKIIEGY
jgi:hypothetical protein